MLASTSIARMAPTNSRTSVACARRCTSLTRAGGWNRPNSGWSPPLELKWLATRNRGLSLKTNSPTSGLRLLVHASLAGSIRPGDTESRGFLFDPATTCTAVVASPPGRSTNVTRAGLKMNATRMLPPGSPPSARLTGSIWRHWYCGPPAATMAAVNRSSVWSAATIPSFVGTVVVLDLLQGDDVRAPQVGDDALGQPRELVTRVGGVEVLDVVGGDGDLVVELRPGRLPLDAAHGHGAELGRLDHEAAELAVVDRPSRDSCEAVAHVHLRERPLSERDERLDQQPPTVLLVVATVEGASPGRGVLVGLGGDEQLVEGCRRAHHTSVGDADTHALA